MNKYTQTDVKDFLEKLNIQYAKLHKTYETNFWKSYMGQPEFNDKMNAAMDKRNAFQADPKNLEMVSDMLQQSPKKLAEKLSQWKLFFTLHQTPEHAQKIRSEIALLENKISEKKNFEKEGYVDPTTKKLITSSRAKMGTAMTVEPDEKFVSVFPRMESHQNHGS